jgi:hypothetical protein
MATALLERPPFPLFTPGQGVRSGGRRLTLEERLQGAWEGLRADGAADCPVCRARMVASAGGGSCTSCGTQLT